MNMVVKVIAEVDEVHIDDDVHHHFSELKVPDMAAIAAPSAIYISQPNKPYCYHHHHHHHHHHQCFTSLSSFPPSTKTRLLKAHTFHLDNSPFPSSSDENPLRICLQNEEFEVGSGSLSGLTKKKMKLDKNHLCHKGLTQLLISHVEGLGAKMGNLSLLRDARLADITTNPRSIQGYVGRPSVCIWAISCVPVSWFISAQTAFAREIVGINAVYEIGELFELGIQLTYLLLLLALLGFGSFFVIRQVLVRRELDLSAKELQEQVRSGDAGAMGLFELGAVMLRRKFYPAAIKYLLQAIEKWDGDEQDLAQVYNALGVSYVLDGKVDKGIMQFENAVKLQPGYVTAWNNLGDAYEKKKEITLALKAFEEALLFDPNNKVARPRRDALSDKVKLYRGVPLKSKKTP